MLCRQRKGWRWWQKRRRRQIERAVDANPTKSCDSGRNCFEICRYCGFQGAISGQGGIDDIIDHSSKEVIGTEASHLYL